MSHGHDAPPDPEPLTGPDHLARAGAARARAFLLRGERGLAHGTELRGLDTLRLDAWRVRGLSLAQPAAMAMVGPHSVRRDLTGASGAREEVFILAPRLPAAVVQIRTRPVATAAAGRAMGAGAEDAATRDAPGPAERDGALPPGSVGPWLHVAVGRADGRAATAERIDAATLALTLEGVVDGETLLVQAHAEASPPEPDDTGGSFRAEVVPGLARWVLAAGRDPAEARRVLEMLRRPRVQERRAEQDLIHATRDGLRVRTGVTAVDQGLAWASLRARSANETAAGGASGGVPDGCWHALGCLATGDPGAAERLLERGAPTPAHCVVGVRLLQWTGSDALLHDGTLDAWTEHVSQRGADALRAWAEAPGGERTEPLDPRSPGMLAAAAESLAEAWESFGRRGRATALRETASRLRAARLPLGRRLPLVGSARGEGPAAGDPATAVLDGGRTRPYDEPSPPGTPTEAALRAWARLVLGDPDRGWADLRGHLDGGFVHGTGLWPRRTDDPPSADMEDLDYAPAAALVPATMLFGLLGARADARLGRLALSPRFPAHLTAIELAGVAVGDARVRLDYRRSDDGHAFTLVQDAGRVPLTVILEPLIPTGGAAWSAFVDGAPAALDPPEEQRGRLRFGMQLPLDRERALLLRPSTGS